MTKRFLRTEIKSQTNQNKTTIMKKPNFKIRFRWLKILMESGEHNLGSRFWGAQILFPTNGERNKVIKESLIINLRWTITHIPHYPRGNHYYCLDVFPASLHISLIEVWFNCNISSRWTTQWVTISIHYEIMTVLYLVTIHHHTKILQHKWPYSLWCTFHPHGSFILLLEASTSGSLSLISVCSYARTTWSTLCYSMS